VTNSRSVLLYDGSCGLCNRVVQLILRHDRRETLDFAALDSGFGRSAVARHPELRDVDSLVWLDPPTPTRPERALIRSAAALRVAEYLGGLWHLAGVSRLLPRSARDALYDAVAHRRYRWFGRADSCQVPPPSRAARFLE
jgi:predicted DCC family thiol-disulfide oxidoreductase YuxK